MTLDPRKFREIIFQILYSESFLFSQEEELCQMLMKENKVAKKYIFQAQEQAKRISEKQTEIDKKIEEVSNEYAFDRISRVEKTILRLSIYELLYARELPPEIIFSEAIRLTRKFGTRESAQFVNALLDKILKK